MVRNLISKETLHVTFCNLRRKLNAHDISRSINHYCISRLEFLYRPNVPWRRMLTCPLLASRSLLPSLCRASEFRSYAWHLFSRVRKRNFLQQSPHHNGKATVPPHLAACFFTFWWLPMLCGVTHSAIAEALNNPPIFFSCFPVGHEACPSQGIIGAFVVLVVLVVIIVSDNRLWFQRRNT